MDFEVYLKEEIVKRIEVLNRDTTTLTSLIKQDITSPADISMYLTCYKQLLELKVFLEIYNSNFNNPVLEKAYQEIVVPTMPAVERSLQLGLETVIKG